MKDPPITLTAFGFQSGRTEIEWKSVGVIYAFKLVLPAWDEIRFSLQPDTGVLFQMSEEQPSFFTFIEGLERCFDGVAGWQRKVTHPAFAKKRNRAVAAKRITQ